MEYHLVETEKAVEEMAQLASKVRLMAVDTESNSRHRFPERVCLIQISFSGTVFIIDPLKIQNLEPLRKLLANKKITKLFHGADYDVRGLSRDWGFEVNGILDSYVAARILGFEKLGLSGLLNDVLNIEIPKDPLIQKQDWSIRPISNLALEYAAADVAYLENLSFELIQGLRNQKRTGWAEEEFKRLEKIRYLKPDQDSLLFAMKESRGLDSRGLAVLKELLNFRTRAAINSSRPPGYLIPSAVLGILAANPHQKLEDVPNITHGTIRRFGKGIHTAIRAGLSGPEIERPKKLFKNGRFTSYSANPVIKRRLRKIKDWRTNHAEILKIDPALIWPVESLKRMSLDLHSINKELKSDEVRKWQKKEFGKSLKDSLKLLVREEKQYTKN